MSTPDILTASALYSALTDALARGLDPDTAVVIGDADHTWYETSTDIGDPTDGSAGHIWFTLYTAEHADPRSTPEHADRCTYCQTYGHLATDCPEQPVTYYAVGWNVAGYMPECDVYVTSDFDSAKRYLIDEMLRAADIADTDAMAADLDNAAQDVNLWSAPGDVCYVEMIDSPHCIPTAFWICETDETPEEES